MPTPKKVETVRELQELFSTATVAISTDYRGLTVADLTALRRRLRDAGIEFHVVKNTLARLAAEQAGRPAFHQILEGPTALVVSSGDQVEAAKTLAEYVRTSRLNLQVRGAVLDRRVLTPAEVSILATLPPRQVVLGQLVGGMQAPLANLVQVLNALLAGLVRVLDARAKQLAGT